MSDDVPLHIPEVLRSSRDDRGRFVLPWPLEESPERGPRDMLRWMLERRRSGVAPKPPADAFPIAVPDIAAPRNGRHSRLCCPCP